MSRGDFSARLRGELDRLVVPDLTAGFVDRVTAAAAVNAPSTRPPRDRRGVWKRGRQAVVATLAFGLLGAAAVASGLLGAAGIRVPVLTAMLAPASVIEPVRVVRVKAHQQVRLKPQAVSVPKVAATTTVAPIADPGPIATGLADHPLLSTRIERSAERRTFLITHPGLARAIAAGPQERRAFMMTHPGMARAIRRRQIELRTRRMAERGLAGPSMPEAADPPQAIAPLGGAPASVAPVSPTVGAPRRLADPEHRQLQRDLRARRAALREMRMMRRQIPH